MDTLENVTGIRSSNVVSVVSFLFQKASELRGGAWSRMRLRAEMFSRNGRAQSSLFLPWEMGDMADIFGPRARGIAQGIRSAARQREPFVVLRCISTERHVSASKFHFSDLLSPMFSIAAWPSHLLGTSAHDKDGHGSQVVRHPSSFRRRISVKDVAREDFAYYLHALSKTDKREGTKSRARNLTA